MIVLSNITPLVYPILGLGGVVFGFFRWGNRHLSDKIELIAKEHTASVADMAVDIKKTVDDGFKAVSAAQSVTNSQLATLNGRLVKQEENTASLSQRQAYMEGHVAGILEGRFNHPPSSPPEK